MATVIPRMDLDEFTDTERWQADDLVRQHGDSADNVTTERIIVALEGGDIDRIVSAVRVRRCVRTVMQKDPYMRRLSDKIAAAVEQAMEQGRVQLAQRLPAAAAAARDAATEVGSDRRHQPVH